MHTKLFNPRDPKRLPPHRLVVDALRPSELRWLTPEKIEEREREHRSDPEKHSLWPCAACHWHDPAVKKVRAKKLKALRRFERTGRLPPLRRPKSKARIPKPLTDKEAARIVLPRSPSPKIWAPRIEEIEGDPVARYTELMGGTVDPRAVDWYAYNEWISSKDVARAA